MRSFAAVVCIELTDTMLGIT